MLLSRHLQQVRTFVRRGSRSRTSSFRGRRWCPRLLALRWPAVRDGFSTYISHKSLYLGRNGMKRMLSVLLFFAVIVSLNCLADSTDAAALFKSKCAMCHGPDGTGNTTMGQKLGIKSYKSPDIQKQSDADLKNAITNGKGKMPSYKSLTPEQVDGLVKYVRELGQ